MYTLNLLANTLLLSGVEIGTHFYWEIGPLSMHGQVFLVSWFVIILLLGASLFRYTIN
jgi:F-type H+-transporting ATPase subunit a